MVDANTTKDEQAQSPVDRGPRTRLGTAEGVVFILLSALVLLAPLPLGSNRPLAWDILGLGVAALLVASLGFSTIEGKSFRKDLVVPVALFALVLCFVFLQVSTYTPVAWHNPIWEQAGEALNRRVSGAIAVDRQAALQHLLRLTSYAGVFLVSALLCREPARARIAVLVTALSGSLYAAYGLAVYWFGNATILWMPKWAYQNALTATFVNRNSAATYFGLCSLGLLCQLSTSFAGMRLSGSPKEKLAGFVDHVSRRIWLFLGLFLVMTACVLTHSRAGLVSTFIGWIVFLVLQTSTPSLRQRRNLALALVGIVSALAIVAVLISGELTFERMEDLAAPGDDQGGRFQVYAIILGAIGDYPILGTGLGSFAPVFEIYRPSSVIPYYDLAHNDYLQNILELGIPAALCLFASVAWLIWLCIRGCWIRRRDAAFSCLGVAASTLVALHTTIDFSLQIPAVTVTYMFLLGIGVAQSRSSRELMRSRR